MIQVQIIKVIFVGGIDLHRIVLLACEQALKCTDMDNRHGAVIFDWMDIYAKGYNKRGILSSLKQRGYKYSVHAEVDALRKRRNNYGDSILVVRFKKGKLMNSKPCENCLRLIKSKGIKHLFYSDIGGFVNYENLGVIR